MAPAVSPSVRSTGHLRQVSRSVSSNFSAFSTRSIEDVSLASIFAVILNRGSSLSTRAMKFLTKSLERPPDAYIAVSSMPLAKRQGNAILAIPTTYAGLDAGPPPGAVVGIILGSVAGFILCLYLLLLTFQFAPWQRETIVEEEIITRRRSRSRGARSEMSEAPPRPSSSRRETVIIEERTRRRSPSPPDEVIVEEHEEDIVEVIEEPDSTVSPAPRPSRRESRRSGYRTVDPGAPGGGDAPLRKVRRR